MHIRSCSVIDVYCERGFKGNFNIYEIYSNIFTFNKHFDKEHDCVDEPLITKPYHWRRLFITFHSEFFIIQKRKLDLHNEIDCHMCCQVN